MPAAGSDGGVCAMAEAWAIRRNAAGRAARCLIDSSFEFGRFLYRDAHADQTPSSEKTSVHGFARIRRRRRLFAAGSIDEKAARVDPSSVARRTGHETRDEDPPDRTTPTLARRDVADRRRRRPDRRDGRARPGARLLPFRRLHRLDPDDTGGVRRGAGSSHPTACRSDRSAKRRRPLLGGLRLGRPTLGCLTAQPNNMRK